MIVMLLTSFCCLIISLLCLVFEPNIEQRVFWVAGLSCFAVALLSFTDPLEGEEEE